MLLAAEAKLLSWAISDCCYGVTLAWSRASTGWNEGWDAGLLPSVLQVLAPVFRLRLGSVFSIYSSTLAQIRAPRNEFQR